MKRKYYTMRKELRAMKSGWEHLCIGFINWDSFLWKAGEIRALVALVMKTL